MTDKTASCRDNGGHQRKAIIFWNSAEGNREWRGAGFSPDHVFSQVKGLDRVESKEWGRATVETLDSEGLGGEASAPLLTLIAH